MKYELTDQVKYHHGRLLHRIKALTTCYHFTAGELGGWVQSMDNLSQEGTCWIFDDAMAFDKARVIEHGSLHQLAIARDNSVVSGYAKVHDMARVAHNAKVTGCAEIHDTSGLTGDCLVEGSSQVWGHSLVYGHAVITGKAYIEGATVSDLVKLSGETQIIGNVVLEDHVEVHNSRLTYGTFGGATKLHDFVLKPLEYRRDETLTGEQDFPGVTRI